MNMKIRKMFEKTSKKYLASEKLHKQIWGAILKRWWILALILAPFIVALKPFVRLVYTILAPIFDPLLTWISDCFVPYTGVLLTEIFNKFVDIDVPCYIVQHHWFQLSLLTLLVLLAISVCRTLTNIFSLQKKDTAITWCQISILISIGCWIIGFLIIFDTRNHPEYAAALGIAGTLLGWIFQDTIKGVVAFIHLRANNLLHIGDWIKIGKHDVDGEIKRVSLTTVTIYNWDTTTSSIPTSMLHSEHFQNLQNMMEGKTYGRRMLKTFIFDTNWFCSLTKEDIKAIEERQHIKMHLTDDEVRNGMLNAKVYRLYLFHWLMNHSHVSQMPRLMVRWLEQKESGMPLQVYVFITDSSLPAFEWQQSQIIEHIIESSSWFNMHLFQEASAYDVSNSNIFLTNNPATYRKEDL